MSVSHPPLQVVILAAPRGKRMPSALPKVLHPLAGKPLLGHVLDTATSLDPARMCVVIGHGGERVKEAFASRRIAWAVQEQQLGTGHAVMQALPHVPGDGVMLVLYGDVPLIAAATLAELVEAASGGALALLTQQMEEPRGYG